MGKELGWVVGVGTFIGLNLATPLFVGAATCSDGWASTSIGRQGACSHHGGVEKHGGLRFLFLVGSVAAGMTVAARRQVPGSNSQQQAPPADGLQSGPVRASLPPAPRPPRPVVPASKGSVACPACGSGMRLRRARHGRHRGKRFWGCSRYPDCRGTKPAGG